MFTSNVFNRARSPASQVDYEAQSRQSDVRSVRSQSPRENRVISNNQRPQSPYVNGKKAADYVAPHLSSNVVFYDHSYGYVNDMPNDRLLSPVQNDRFNRKKQVTYAEPQAQTPPKEKNSELVRNQSAIQPRRLGSGDYEKDQYTKIGERRGSNRQEMTSPRNEETNKRAAGVSTRKNEEGNVRDDRSEASTIVSNLSSTAYLCPKCFNRHLGGDRKTQCMIERERDIANERKIASYNQRLQEDEDARRNKERARRVNEGKEIHDKLNQEYEAKLDYRRSPKKSEGGTTLSKIFENEEELRFRQSELGSFFRSTLKDQMRRNEYDREMEKFNNSKPYDTSLRVGEGYRNKYIESPQSVLATLKDQVEERAYLQAREKDLDRKEAQDRISYAQRQQEEEDRRNNEKNYNMRRELRDTYYRSQQEKQARQADEMMNKFAERNRVDQAYEDYKYKQQDHEEKVKRQIAGFRQEMLNSQKNTSYRQMYEERKAQKEATSFDPSRKGKKVYPCGECNGLYEKNYLTKYD